MGRPTPSGRHVLKWVDARVRARGGAADVGPPAPVARARGRGRDGDEEEERGRGARADVVRRRLAHVRRRRAAAIRRLEGEQDIDGRVEVAVDE